MTKDTEARVKRYLMRTEPILAVLKQNLQELGLNDQLLYKDAVIALSECEELKDEMMGKPQPESKWRQRDIEEQINEEKQNIKGNDLRG